MRPMITAVQELVAVHNKPCPIRKVDEDGAVGTGSVGDANVDVCAGAGRVAVGLSFEVGSEGRGHFNAPGGAGERWMLVRSFRSDEQPSRSCCAASAAAFSPTWCLLAEPVVEPGRPELSAITRQEGALAQPGPEVPGLRIGDHDALIPHRAQPFSHEIR